jgi:hypothetical protein
MTDLDDIVRGDRRTINVTNLVDENGAAASFTGSDIIRWTAKHSVTDDDADAIIAKSSSTGGISFTPGQDNASITILPTDFSTTVTGITRYFWDLQVAIGGSALNVRTLASGTGKILGDITQVSP